MLDDIIGEFYIDTQSHIETIEEDLLQLERDLARSDLIDDIFRRVHSVKGNAGVLGLLDIYEYGQEFETFLDGVRERKIATPSDMDQMFHGLDKLKLKVGQARGDAPDGPVNEIAPPPPAAAPPSAAAAPPSAAAAPPAAAPPATRAGAAPPPSAAAAPPAAAAAKSVALGVDLEKAKSGTIHDDSVTFLIFELAGERYGVEIMKIREIILQEPITPVPNTLDFVAGVMNLRDQVIPVFNLRRKLNIPPDDGAGGEKNIIVLEIEKTVTGLMVDEVTGILSILHRQVAPPVMFEGTVATEYLYGMGNTNDGTVILLDASVLCAPDEILF